MNYIKYNKSILFAAELMAKACADANRKIHKNMNFKVSHEQYLIMETIVQTPGAIQTTIAKKILMQCSYVCKLLAQLEEEGFIERKKAIRGKKQITYENYLTKNGEAEYNKIHDFYESITQKFETTYKEICYNISKEYSEPKYKNLDMDIITKILLQLTEKIIEEKNLKF